MAKHTTITNPFNKNLVRDFITTARGNGINHFYISDRALSLELKTLQLRGGKVAGREVLAFGLDELQNIIALTTDRVVLSLD